MTTTVVGHFSNGEQAKRALEDLDRSGITASDVSFLSHDSAAANPDLSYLGAGSEAMQGATAGVVSGALLGLSALAIPGIGPVVAAGPIAATLAGGAAGGMLGALAELGIPDAEARRWSESIRDGAALVLIRAEDTHDIERARGVLETHAPLEITEHRIAAEETGGVDPHEAPANYGDEGGSSQWAQTVLRPDGIADRTVSRDAGPVSGDENPHRGKR